MTTGTIPLPTCLKKTKKAFFRRGCANGQEAQEKTLTAPMVTHAHAHHNEAAVMATTTSSSSWRGRGEDGGLEPRRCEHRVVSFSLLRKENSNVLIKTSKTGKPCEVMDVSPPEFKVPAARGAMLSCGAIQPGT